MSIDFGQKIVCLLWCGCGSYVDNLLCSPAHRGCNAIVHSQHWRAQQGVLLHCSWPQDIIIHIRNPLLLVTPHCATCMSSETLSKSSLGFSNHAEYNLLFKASTGEERSKTVCSACSTCKSQPPLFTLSLYLRSLSKQSPGR